MLFVSSLVSSQLLGQGYFYNDKYYDVPIIIEMGCNIGVMNCLTDLGGHAGAGRRFIKDINWKNSQLYVGAYAGFLYNNCIGLQLKAGIGKVTAYDSILKTPATQQRYTRNLHFRSTIMEVLLIGEIHPLYLRDPEYYNDPLLSPYLLAGIGVYKFKPQAFVDDRWIDLQPLRTEGQGFIEYPGRQPYKLTQLNIPLGLGMKYELSPVVNFRMEFIYRMLITDYLDDVSTAYVDPAVFYRYFSGEKAWLAERLANRSFGVAMPGDMRGNGRHRDAYFSVGVKVGVVINRKRR